MWPRKGSKEEKPDDTESSVGSTYTEGLWFSHHLVGNFRTTGQSTSPEETRQGERSFSVLRTSTSFFVGTSTSSHRDLCEAAEAGQARITQVSCDLE